MYVSPYGKTEGLSKRLDKWASDLGKNSTYPWVGLGLIADLKAAAAVIDGRPIPDEDQEPAPKTPEPKMEFDL